MYLLSLLIVRIYQLKIYNEWYQTNIHDYIKHHYIPFYLYTNYLNNKKEELIVLNNYSKITVQQQILKIVIRL